jgi:ribosome maturation factor RimP
MMVSKENLEIVSRLAEPILMSLGLELLELKYIPRRHRSLLQFTIDKMDGFVSVADCENFNRHLSRILDVEDPIPSSYSLEVSSPGFKRLIRIPKDLDRFIEHRIRITLLEPLSTRKVWIGILKSTSDPLVLSDTEIGSIEIPFIIIDKANLDE